MTRDAWRRALVAFGLALAPVLCKAAVIETETGGLAVNNSLSAAQRIALADFAPNGSPLGFGTAPTATVIGFGGDEDVDFLAFDALPGLAWFDVDAADFDAILSLFDSDGTLLAYADDMLANEADPGSSSHFDPFLGNYLLPHSGTYYLAVSAFGVFGSNLPVGAFSGIQTSLVRPDGGYGGTAVDGAPDGESGFLASAPQPAAAREYLLRISLERPAGPSPMPAPGTLVLLLTGMALLAWRRQA